jgi:hypothetical protein
MKLNVILDELEAVPMVWPGAPGGMVNPFAMKESVPVGIAATSS